MNARSLTRFVSGAVAVLVAAIAWSTCMTVTPAWADAQTGQVSGGNGWTLAYVADGGEAYISSVVSAGSGALSIPSTAGGATVTAIGDDAFNSASDPSMGAYVSPYAYYKEHGIDLGKSLTRVSIPSTVTDIGVRAFFRCGSLAEVVLPSSVARVHNNCFQFCTGLKSVTYQVVSEAKSTGKTRTDASGYIGRYAFSGCTALTSFEIPALSEDMQSELASVSGASEIGDVGKRIGQGCFQNCAALDTLVFYGGSSGGASNYFAASNCLSGCTALDTLVYYCAKATIQTNLDKSSIGPMSHVYYSVDFYASTPSSGGSDGYVGTVTYPADTDVLDLLAGKADRTLAYGSHATVPQAPSGKSWGVGGRVMMFYSLALSDSIEAVAADVGNLDYAWVTSQELIDNTTSSSAPYSSRYTTTFHLDERGKVAALYNLSVKVSDGSALDPSLYELYFEKGTTTGTGSSAVTEWAEVDPGDVVAGGSYRVTAYGTGGYSTTHTASVAFTVEAFEPAIHAIAGSKASMLAYANLGAAEALAVTPSFNVVVPADVWQYGLVGAGLAGVGGGVVIQDPGKGYDEASYRAFVATGADEVLVLGSSSQVMQSKNVSSGVYLLDSILGRNLKRSGRLSGASVQETALMTYYNVATYGMRSNYWGKTWSNTAVVASGSRSFGALPAAQIAYEEKAPVFLTDSNGSLTSTSYQGKTALDYLASDGFDKILVVGDEGSVSNGTLASIQSATGVVPTRVLSGYSTTGEASRAYAQETLSAKASGAGTVVVADGRDAASTVAAAQLAACLDGVMLACTSTVDCKAAEQFVQGVVGAGDSIQVGSAWLVGDFSGMDAVLAERIASAWTASPLPSAWAGGDSVEADGCIYQLNGNKAAVFQGALDDTAKSLKIGSVAYGGVTYKVSRIACDSLAMPELTSLSIGGSVSSLPSGLVSSCGKLASLSVTSTAVKVVPASLCKGLAKLSKVSFAGTLTSVGKAAFSGCKALKTVSASLLNASAIGQNAFYKCTSLASAKLGSRVKTLGASAFYGCTALKSLTVGKAVKSIGKRAFAKCSKLAAITISTKKLTKSNVGANAFSGTPSKAVVKVPASKRSAYATILRAKGLSKKATVR